MIEVQSALSTPSVSPAKVAVAIRGSYDEIQTITDAAGEKVAARGIIDRFASVLPEKFVDFDKKKRGDCLNLDLYGYDEAQQVAVVQIRHSFRRYRNGFLNTHKDYVLVGLNETGTMFRHPVSANAVRAGIRQDGENPVAAVRAAQRWMWNVTAAQLAAGIRQGDILLVPVRGKPANAVVVDERVVLVGETHEVHALAFVKDAKGVVYAQGPTIRHTKGQHANAYGDGDGWHRVAVGREAPTWKWGQRLGD